jgi:predicted ATP-grasp superfamily ATP-dependent carboligase
VARILVLDAQSSAALAFIRSLGRAGHWIAAGAEDGVAVSAFQSRYCRVRWRYPAPVRGATRFVESAAAFARQNNVELVLPMTDATTWPLARLSDRFAGISRVCAPSPAAVERSSDKYWAVNAAREAGIRTPETLLACGLEDIEPARAWDFPIVVKDRYSMRWKDELGIPGSVRFAFSWDVLVAAVRDRLTQAGDVMVQRFAPGTGMGFAAFAVNGEIYAPFQWQRIREKDPRGSGSSARRSVRLDPQVVSASRALLQRAGFEGIAMVEYKEGPDRDLPTLMEINGRPWGSMHLALYCGVDYPRYLVDWYLEGRTPPTSVDYKVGITGRSLVGDLVHLENVWRGAPDGWPVPYPQFWSSLQRVAVPWYPGLRYDDFMLGDVRPGLFELRRWCHARFLRLS